MTIEGGRRRSRRTKAPLRVVVVGGVAGGMSAATRLRRLNEQAEITVIERSGHVSYANCGLPYFVGGVIEDEDDLLLQTPESLFERYRLAVHTDTEVVAIEPLRHQVVARHNASGEAVTIPYDKLVLSPGAFTVRPPIPGFKRARTLRTVEDAEALAADLLDGARTGVIIGAGLIGVETAENLTRQGVQVSLVDAADQVLPPFDPEIAVLLAAELEAHGVGVVTGASVSRIDDEAVVLADGRRLEADLVVASLGIRPDTRLAELGGLSIGPNGAIAVDAYNRTSDPDIYAVGDAVEKMDMVGGGSSLIALANVANRQGRRVADSICGIEHRPTPSVGTSIVRVFDLTAAATGWSEKRLREAGRRYRAIHSHPLHHAAYFPGAKPMSLKLVFDPVDGSILGAQAVGQAGVDKRIDVIATSIAGAISADRLADLELAYSPPFSSAKDPINMLGYMAENVRSGACDVVDHDELARLVGLGWTLLDIRTPSEHAHGSIPGSTHIPLDRLREELDGRKGPFVVYCQVGQRGHTATALLHELGIEARNLDGGYKTWLATRASRAQQPRLLDGCQP